MEGSFVPLPSWIFPNIPPKPGKLLTSSIMEFTSKGTPGLCCNCVIRSAVAAAACEGLVVAPILPLAVDAVAGLAEAEEDGPAALMEEGAAPGGGSRM